MSMPADWYPDPSGRHEHRYWDGSRWTAHVSSHGRQGTDPDATSMPPPTVARSTDKIGLRTPSRKAPRTPARRAGAEPR